MPGSNPLTVPSLVASSQGASEEDVFNQAHAFLDSLEAPISRLYDLKVFADGLQHNPEAAHLGPGPDVSVATHLGLAEDLNVLVDECLFNGEAFSQPLIFDKFLQKITQDVNTDTSRLQEFVELALGHLPDQIPSAQGQASGLMYQELASLHGSSDLPSLRDSFSRKSQADVKKQAQDVIKTLERLLRRVKDVALIQIYRGHGNFYTWGLHDLYETAGGLARLHKYVKRSQRDSQTISKFMACKVDRAATRLSCQMRALMVAHSDVEMMRVPTERRRLNEVLERCDMDHEILSQLLEEWHSLLEWLKGQGDPDAAKDWAGRVDVEAISTRLNEHERLQDRLRSMIEPCEKVLGENFFITALGILHSLLNDDARSLEKLNWDLGMMIRDQGQAQGPRSSRTSRR